MLRSNIEASLIAEKSGIKKKFTYLLYDKIVWMKKGEMEILSWLIGKPAPLSILEITYPLCLSNYPDLSLLGYTGIQLKTDERVYTLSGVKGGDVKELLRVTRDEMESIDKNIDDELLSSIFSSTIPEQIIYGQESVLDLFWTLLTSLQGNNYVPKLVYRNIFTRDESILTNLFIQRILNQVLFELANDFGTRLTLRTDIDGNPKMFNGKDEVGNVHPTIKNIVLTLGSLINYLVQGNIVIWVENNTNLQLFKYFSNPDRIKKVVGILEREVLTRSYPQLIIFPGDDYLIPPPIYDRGLKYTEKEVKE